MARRSSRPRLAALLVAAVAAAALAACGGSPSATGRLAVVAGEDQWGSVAAQVGGDRVSVTSLITDPTADPHEYTPTAADALAIHGAAVVVQNGAGYDNFVAQLLAASGTSPHVLVVARLAHATGGNPNPHFWYDLTTVRRVASALAAAYTRERPAEAAYFAARLRRFDASLEPVEAIVQEIARRFHGTPVAYTERVPGYLCAAAGLRVVTPPAFARAIEAGEEPNLAATQAMAGLVAHHGLRVLLYNVQTVSAVTTQVEDAARAAGIPIVGVAETLPTDEPTLEAWQLAQDTALLHALER